MDDEPSKESLLEGYRILDLTDEKGLLCGRCLGDWGADVIKLERPGGDRARNIGPFYEDQPDPQKSLFWFACNANKRSTTLNLETVDGREIFKQLVKTADFVIESFDPGYMESLALGFSDLEKLNPGIIMTSITPFGQTGPYSHFKGSDMVLWALGGMMYLCGDPDRPPVQLAVPQANFHGAMHGAVGSMMALYYRELTGEGQQVDVSIQEAVDFTNMVADETYDLLGVNQFRSGAFYTQIRREPMGALYERVNWACKDGYISTLFRGGASGFKDSARALVAWMREEGEAGELDNYDWETYNFATISQEERNHLEKTAIEFFKTKTKKELADRAAKEGMILAPLSTVKDLLESEQLNARNYWIEVKHPELDKTITYPGASVKTNAAPWQFYCRAPLIGEHNEEIYIQELGFSRDQLVALKGNGAI
jgi:crotonobetainyl-CoA:carnitine CoA-transferase CaiB-like acyl-CoA transferase